jgi:hypothetical protein
MNRREMIITDRGLYGRPSRGERIANLFLCALFGVLGAIVLADSAASRDWSSAAVAFAFVLLAVLGWITGAGVPPYRPVLEIRDGRVFMAGRDCGPPDGAYLQPEVRGKCAIFLHTATAPYGVHVLQLVNRRDTLTLYGLLMQHLHLDGSCSGDWPPRPERNGSDADRSA